MAYSKKQDDQSKQYLKWGVIGVVVIVVVAFGKTLLNKFSSGFALIGAKKDGDKIYQDMNSSDPNNVRLPFIRSQMEAVHGEIHSFNQDEKKIVKLMNDLANGNEVASASRYYQTAYSSSLRADLQSALDSSWNPFGWFSSTTWNDLKDYVKQNVV